MNPAAAVRGPKHVVTKGATPVLSPAETVAGKCLGCQTQFAVDVRLPLPAACADCGADVLARADIKGPDPPGRPPFNALRIRRTKP